MALILYHRSISRENPIELPIFELPLAILPRERTGLHIFEERYKRMVGHSLETSEPFGILLRDDEGPREIGCTAFVDQVLERYDDGRLDIIVRGAEPFRVLNRFETPEWPAGQIEKIVDSPGPGSDAEAAEVAREHFAALAERSTGEAPDPEELAVEDSYGIAGRVELPSETKQRLLELRDEDERMQLVARALAVAAKALDKAEKRAARASSNGHLHPGG
ncbi:MAG: LON peptidase substrate-binding domain-containing protein [Solirubrobacterales bacterium]